MEVQLQLRTHHSHGTISYPLSLDQRIEQGEQFRQAKTRLEAALQSIEEFYSSLRAGRHTGQPGCERCTEKKLKIREAYHDYYLPSEPGSWSLCLPQYREEVERRFSKPGDYSLEDIHALFQSALREHLKRDLCTTLPTDTRTTYDLKRIASGLFDSQRPLNEILSQYTSLAIEQAPELDERVFISAINASQTKEERAQIYIKYYCTPNWQDSSQQKAFKMKYARMFESLVPHDQVVAAMKKEAGDTQSDKISELQSQLSEVQMAQSAYMKAKAKKTEKEGGSQDRGPSQSMEHCSLEGCPRSINLVTDDAIECALCEWLEIKRGDRGHFFYCSVEHANEDFAKHDLQEHICCMGTQCYYYPHGNPSESLESVVGICRDCEYEEIISYFCSQACYEHNLDLHHEKVHLPMGMPFSSSDYLELFSFRPAGAREDTWSNHFPDSPKAIV